MVNLAMALVWFLGGLAFLVLSWTQTDWDPRSLDQMRLFGWVALALAVYNVVRWRLGSIIRKARAERDSISAYRGRYRHERIEEFDFSKSQPSDPRIEGAKGDAKDR